MLVSSEKGKGFKVLYAKVVRFLDLQSRRECVLQKIRSFCVYFLCISVLLAKKNNFDKTRTFKKNCIYFVES